MVIHSHTIVLDMFWVQKKKNMYLILCFKSLLLSSFSTSIVLFIFCSKWVLITGLYYVIVRSLSYYPEAKTLCSTVNQTDYKWARSTRRTFVCIFYSFILWCSSQVRDNATLVLSRVPQTQQNYDQNQENHEERKHFFLCTYDFHYQTCLE